MLHTIISKLLICVACLFSILQAAGQNNQIDSLNRLIRLARTDTARINLAIKKIVVFSSSNLDSAVRLAGETVAASAAIQYKLGEGKARHRSAIVYCYQGNYTEAKMHLVKAEQIFRSLNDSSSLGKLYSGPFGMMYGMQGKYDSATIYFKRSIPFFERVGDKESIAYAYQNIAISYQQTSDLKMALSYLQRAMNIQEEINNVEGQATILVNMGNTLQDLGDILRSEQAYLKAIDIAKTHGQVREEMYAYSNLSSLYVQIKNIYPAYDAAMIAIRLAQSIGDKGMQAANLSKAAGALAGQQKMDEAEQMAALAIRIADSSGQAFNINQAYGTMGSILKQQGRYTKAIPFLEKCFAVLDETEVYSAAIGNNYSDLAYCYEKTGNFQKALIAYKKAAEISDSALNKENVRKTTEMSLNYEFDKKQQAAQLEQRSKEAAANARQTALVIGLVLTLLLAGVSFVALRSKQRANRIINREKKRSDDLLLNILPEEVAEELKNKGFSEAKGYDLVTVLFADIKEFTKMGEQLSPKELVNELDYYFSAFDKIMEESGIEKIKTIGDAYLCAGGLPVSNTTHATDVVGAAVKMQVLLQEVQQQKMADHKLFFEFRIGIHTGPVVAGIVGVKKFAYDIWGDTVNTAARMEQSSEPGKINISGETYAFVKDAFHCHYRGRIAAKHKQDMDMYFVEQF